MLLDHLLKTKTEFKKSKKRDIQGIYRKELDKAWFQHDMAYGDFKDLYKRTAAYKLLHNIAFDIAKNSKYDR